VAVSVTNHVQYTWDSESPESKIIKNSDNAVLLHLLTGNVHCVVGKTR